MLLREYHSRFIPERDQEEFFGEEKEKRSMRELTDAEQQAALLASFLTVTDRLPAEIVAALASHPELLTNRLQQVMDPLGSGGYTVVQVIRLDGPEPLGHYLADLYDGPDQYGAPIVATADMQDMTNQQYEVGIFDSRGLCHHGLTTTEAGARALAAKLGWVTPSVEIGILLSMVLGPLQLELLGLQSVVVMHEPIVCSSGDGDMVRALLQLKRARVNEGLDLYAPDHSSLTAWWLRKPDQAFRSKIGFAFLIPVDTQPSDDESI